MCLYGTHIDRQCWNRCRWLLVRQTALNTSTPCSRLKMVQSIAPTATVTLLHQLSPLLKLGWGRMGEVGQWRWEQGVRVFWFKKWDFPNLICYTDSIIWSLRDLRYPAKSRICQLQPRRIKGRNIKLFVSLQKIYQHADYWLTCIHWV